MRNLFKKKPKTLKLEALELSPDGYCAVVGESYYQDALRATKGICAPGPEGRPTFTAVLVAEPDNPHDANAIAVHSPRGKVGHLSRDNALAYGPVLSEVARLGFGATACEAYLTGGDRDKPSFGIVLRLGSPDECLEDLRKQS